MEIVNKEEISQSGPVGLKMSEGNALLKAPVWCMAGCCQALWAAPTPRKCSDLTVLLCPPGHLLCVPCRAGGDPVHTITFSQIEQYCPGAFVDGCLPFPGWPFPSRFYFRISPPEAFHTFSAHLSLSPSHGCGTLLCFSSLSLNLLLFWEEK